MKLITALAFCIFTIPTTPLCAQSPRTASAGTQAKFIVPKLTTSLGVFKDSMGASATDAAAAIAKSLKITDPKGGAYTLLSYQFLYRQIVVTEDENLSGKMMKTTAIKSSLFKASPLPALWVNIVGENLHPGELLYFFAVTVKDAQGHIMYAPDLKLMIQ